MVLLSELLDDHRDALKVREGKVFDLHLRMEELSAAGQAVTKEIGQLKENLSHEVAARLSYEEEVVRLKGKLEKKGSDVQKRDSELQQKVTALLEADRISTGCGCVQRRRRLP